MYVYVYKYFESNNNVSNDVQNLIVEYFNKIIM